MVIGIETKKEFFAILTGDKNYYAVLDSELSAEEAKQLENKEIGFFYKQSENVTFLCKAVVTYIEQFYNVVIISFEDVEADIVVIATGKIKPKKHSRISILAEEGYKGLLTIKQFKKLLKGEPPAIRWQTKEGKYKRYAYLSVPVKHIKIREIKI